MVRSLFLVIFTILCCVFGWVPETLAASKPDTVQTIKEKEHLADRVKIRYIYPSGNKHTRRSIIIREMSVDEGDHIQSDSLEHMVDINQKRLFNLSLFTEVIINVSRVNDSMVDMYIRMKEQWYVMPELAFQLADRNFNVWWKEQNHDIRRANLRVSMKHRNFRGNMETLSATAQIGYTQKFGLEYFKPYVDKKQQHGVGGSINISQNEETFYITDSNKLRFIKKPGKYIIRTGEVAAVYTYRPAYETRHLFELRYKDVKIDDTIAKLNPDYFKNGGTEMKMFQLLYRYELNRVDNWNYPLAGSRMVSYAHVRFGLQGFGFQGSVTTETGYFKKLAPKWFFSNIFRGRLTTPVDQPYILRNGLGSESEYIRGYEYYVVDGSQYGLVRNNLKFQALNIVIRNIPLKYLSAIPLRIYPKVFTDVGYVANRFPGNSFLNNKLLYSAGAGVDFVSAYDFKIRVEYAWNHLGEKGLFLHINSE